MSLLHFPPDYDADKLDLITQQLINKFKGSLTRCDILHVCNEGLRRAMEKHEPGKGEFCALYNVASLRLLINAKRDKYNHGKSRVNGAAETLTYKYEDGSTHERFITPPSIIWADILKLASDAGMEAEAVTILEMTYFQGMSTRKIAEELGTNHTTVVNVLKTAIYFLRTHFTKAELLPHVEKQLIYFKPPPIEWARIFTTSESEAV